MSAIILCTIACIVGFGGALILTALLQVALRKLRLRRRAADPYAKSFGDYPFADIERARQRQGVSA